METPQQIAVRTYIKHRLAGEIDAIIKLISSSCVLIDSDAKKTEFTGEEAIRKFFSSHPPPSITPSISDPTLNKDGTVTIILSVLVKTLTVTFSFDTNSSLINRIVLVEGGLLSGWI